jgi:hypothetical protein
VGVLVAAAGVAVGVAGVGVATSVGEALLEPQALRVTPTTSMVTASQRELPCDM